MISPDSVRDQVVFAASPARLRVPAFTVIDRIQNYTPGEQLLGTAIAVVAMAEATGMSLHDLLTIARNCMAHVEGPFSHHVQAIRDYAKHELTRQPRGR